MNRTAKVQLRAFNSRLISKSIEWPADKIGEDIYLPLDMEKPGTPQKDTSIKLYEKSVKIGRFEWSGGYGMNDDMPAIYVLVGIEQ